VKIDFRVFRELVITGDSTPSQQDSKKSKDNCVFNLEILYFE